MNARIQIAGANLLRRLAQATDRQSNQKRKKQRDNAGNRDGCVPGNKP